ncbi:MAG TPA: hypothetical protein VFK04_02335 [Gemmatimonadaceae bacterium]|nr:hypothetical protein [Gemmatimonadaceae bacterium]
MNPTTRFNAARFAAGALAITMLCAAPANAQFNREPGKSIGTVTTQGSLIVLTLNEDALGPVNLFDLDHRTLRFTPSGSGYRVENVPLRWDAEFGAEMPGADATLKNFAFPFSGKSWRSISVGVTGSLTFGDPPGGARRVTAQSIGDSRNRGGGLSVDRFALLQEAAPELINTVPAISVFFKPRMYGKRYLKELSDRAVVTWDLTEPVGGIQDMTWKPTVNRFQAVLRKDGAIELSYNDVHAQDAIVGVYPMVTAGKEKTLATIESRSNADVAPNLDVTSVKLSAVDGVFLKATIGTRGTVLPESDSGIAGISYRVCLSATKPDGECSADASSGAVWTIMGTRSRGGRRAPRSYRYAAFGAGVQPTVEVDGRSISVKGTLPAELRGARQLFVSTSVQSPGAPAGIGQGPPAPSERAAPITVDHTAPQQVRLSGLASPALDFSSVKKQDGPFRVAYESFHYVRSPSAVDLTCSVISALGDNFDMLAYYSDFRIDNPEAGTPSNGPRGWGPGGSEVTGIGDSNGNLASYCSERRFQWQFIQPVYVGANQMAEYPPDGLTDDNRHNIGAYLHQLAQRTTNGKIPPYDYAITQIAHEMGHRWSAFASAKVNGETIVLGPTHWDRGLQAPVPFPYQRPIEASAMGGGVWQDNYDGTFTQLDDNYYVPATGWSYLDLYLMGLAAPSEVPDFFILRNLERVGQDDNGNPIYKADRTKITIEDVIAAEGPRRPDVDHSQRDFNTGMVLVVEHGKKPSEELIQKVDGIRKQWMEYWETSTGHRSRMTTNPR